MKYPGEKIFVLNPAYNLRTDMKRVILFNSSIDAAVRMDASDILVCLHPLLAVILSLFDGKKQIQTESVCSVCDDFEACHQRKGVCWKEILYAYGEDNWDFPDPRCPKAPAPFREFYLK